MAPIISLQPVDMKKAQVALELAPQVVLVVTQLPKPQSSKPASSSASVKPQSASQQTSSQEGCSKLKDNSLTSTFKVASGMSQHFHGHHYQKLDATSSCSHSPAALSTEAQQIIYGLQFGHLLG